MDAKLSWTDARLAEGLKRYRAQEFFVAHEFWESVWLELSEPEKTFLQALIQVTAAFHHWQRNNPRGTAALLEAALRRLSAYPPRFAAIDVTALRGDIRAWLQALELRDSPALAFPNIGVDEDDGI